MITGETHVPDREPARQNDRAGAVSRRCVLGSLVAAGILPAIPWIAVGLPDARAAALTASLGRRDSALVVGAAVRAANLLPAPPEQFAADLSAEVNALLPAFASRDDIRQALASLVRRDCGAGRMVVLDGWMLSLTEARLCALVHAEDESRSAASAMTS